MNQSPIAFMSYVRFDDQHEKGRLTQLCDRLSGEVRLQSGDNFHIFQDRNDITWGQQWQQRIDSSLDAVTFLIPIVTPGFFKSAPCRDELNRFLVREKQLRRDDLILPIYYVECPTLSNRTKRESDPLAEVIAARQYVDWRGLRFESFTSPEVGETLAKMAGQIVETLERVRSGTRSERAALLTPSSSANCAPFEVARNKTPLPGVESRPCPNPHTELPTDVVDALHRGMPSHRDAIYASGMNPKSTFDSFTVGEANQVAIASVLVVAQRPAKVYNPLFIYGSMGTGKTHLLHAVGQHIKKDVNTCVLYVPSEQFTNEFLDASETGDLASFRRCYRKADVLLIDDIQFFAGKKEVQEELVHTLNMLAGAQKQIILSCDRPPTKIRNLDRRLISRFGAGLTVELQQPDLNARVAILMKKAQVLQIKLDAEVFVFIAQHIQTDIRRLEGALLRIASFISLSGRQLTQPDLERLVEDIL